MNLILYPRLSTRSRRAIKRSRGRWGNPYEYRPRGNLVARLAREMGWSREQVYDRLAEERDYLLRRNAAVAPESFVQS